MDTYELKIYSNLILYMYITFIIIVLLNFKFVCIKYIEY